MKTRYIIAIAAAALMLAGCQRESLVADSDVQYNGKISYAPGVAGIGSGSAVGVRSGLTDGSAVIGSESLTLRSADGRFTIPMTLTVTGAQAADVTSGAPTKSTLINENGDITTASDFATAISSTFWVAAWSNDATPVQIIPDAYARDEDEDGNLENHGFLAGGYVSANKEYQKVVYRTKGVAGNDLTTPYWMTMQPQISAYSGDADDEYKWKKNEAEKTFYAYANVPAGATVAQLNVEGTLKQTLTCTGVPTQDILMGYYSGDGSTGDPEKQTGTARIQFHHPLAAVKFKTGTLASGVTISGVAIEMIYGKVGEGDDGKLMVTQKGHSFTWTRADGDAFKEENLLPEVSAACDGDAVLVIPQSLPSKARIRVTLQQDDEAFNVYTTLSGSWSASYVYTYTIGYNPPLLPGKFSISPTEYVQFSRGNLQATYHTATSSYSWDFAVNQYDCIGENPGNTTIDSQTDNAVVDLFGWSTTATNYGISTKNGDTDYPGDFVDWSKALDNSDWFTLSKDEWNYIINVRTVNGATGYGNTCVWATVNSVPGLIIFCDGYTGAKTDLTAIPEDCVFLPASGYRSGTIFKDKDPIGRYWTSNKYDDIDAYDLKFTSSGITDPCVSINRRLAGMSVRLVQKFDESVSSISLSSSSEEKYKSSEPFKLTATIVPKDAKVQLQWTSSDENVATVDDNGGVTIKNTGIAVITCKDSYTQLSATCTLSVRPIQDKSQDNLSKYFTVNSLGKKILFARGNLYFNGSAFDFETNQYDCRTYAGKEAIINGVYSATGTPVNNWGLFGFSVDRDGNNYGMSTSEDWNVYANYDYDFKDWGGAVTSYDGTVWRTLAKAEWEYIVHERENHSNLRGYAKVNGVNGVILLPDGFELPGGCEFDPSKIGDDSDPYNWSKGSYNVYDIDAWSKMETAGAVFLPAAGVRNGKTINSWQQAGSYFSATKVWMKIESTNHWLGYNFYYITLSMNATTSYCNVSDGSAVRLVTEVEN